MNDLNQIINSQRDRIAQLEAKLKESDEDLARTQRSLSQYESKLEEIEGVFIDSDGCLFFEPFNAKNLSYWLLNKFAIRQQIKALEKFENVSSAAWDAHPDAYLWLRSEIANKLTKLRQQYRSK